jgi:hypothetical protein
MKANMILSLAAGFVLAVQAQAQHPYFPVKTGMTLVYAQKDGKGKVQSYSKQMIGNIEGTDNDMTISYVTEILDNKQRPANPPVEIAYKVRIKDNVLIFDLKSMLGKIGQGDIEMKGVALEIPSGLRPGNKLKDAEVSMQMGFIKASAVMTEGECIDVEETTTEAGTFACVKVSQMVNSSAMGIKMSGKQLTWYAPGIGAVKTEAYNKNKLQTVTELVRVE